MAEDQTHPIPQVRAKSEDKTSPITIPPDQPSQTNAAVDSASDLLPHTSTRDESLIESNQNTVNATIAPPGNPLAIAPILDKSGQPLSKNQLKKLRKNREWEANRDARKARRREKHAERKVRKRVEKAAAAAAATATDPHQSNVNGDGELRDADDENEMPAAKRARLSTSDADHHPNHNNSNVQPINGSGPNEADNLSRNADGNLLTPLSTSHPLYRHAHTPLPVTFILDCSYDSLMTPPEITSLCAQITRAYSDCHRARYQPGGGLIISSFSGRTKERFNNELEGTHKGWKKAGVSFTELGFAEAAKDSRSTRGGGSTKAKMDLGRMEGAFAKYATPSNPATNQDKADENEIIYLTSDSPGTLTHLCPHGTYIIGGLVDRNRHKGICYKRAVEAGIRTAKLPIGEFMQMQSRAVLTTNQVVEILLRWLELGDWGEAFLRVIPKRKGGKLREDRRGVREDGGSDGGEKGLNVSDEGVSKLGEGSDT